MSRSLRDNGLTPSAVSASSDPKMMWLMERAGLDGEPMIPRLAVGSVAELQGRVGLPTLYLQASCYIDIVTKALVTSNVRCVAKSQNHVVSMLSSTTGHSV